MSTTSVYPYHASRSYAGGPINFLFLVWILSLPFYHFSVIGTFSVDDILGPALLLLWLFTRSPASSQYRARRIKLLTVTLILIFIFIFGIVVSYVSSLDLFISKGYLAARRCLYMVLPLLFIKDFKMLGRANSMIVIVAVIAALSGLLASMGIISPVVERVSDSRIGLEALPKAIGFFSNYGDVAMLTCYAILLAIAVPRERFLFGYGNLIIKFLVLSCLLAGLLGLQSRNIMLTWVVGVLAYFVLLRLYKSPPMLRITLGAVLLGGVFSSLIIVLVFSSEIIDLLKNWGGGSASASAQARLYQYEVALGVANESLISGVGLETYRKIGYILDGIHNMWLYLMVQGGMISVFAMMGLILQGLMGALRSVQRAEVLRPEAFAGAALIFGMLVSTMFYAGSGEIYWFMLGTVTSISIVFVNTSEAETATKKKTYRSLATVRR